MNAIVLAQIQQTDTRQRCNLFKPGALKFEVQQFSEENVAWENTNN